MSTFTIQHDIPLAEKTWFKTGGPARFYCEPQTAEDFLTACSYAHDNKLPIFVLGEGANLLISDTGFQGLVIHPNNTTITHKNLSQETVEVTAGAGTPFAELITYCLDNQILGLEEFSGIPGTVGGSVFINIHYFQFLLSDFLTSAHILNLKTNHVEIVDRNWFNFGYDYSTLHQGDSVLVDATFTLKNCTPLEAAYAKGRSAEIIRHRQQRYPNSNTCGSFFRNFHDDEVTIVSNGKKMIFTAYYLDKIGIKGQLSQGGATVSYKHANMIVTEKSARSEDVIQLARTMQKKVFDAFGVLPQPECQLIGFESYPLLQK